MATRCAARFAQDVWPAVGRKAVFCACHCFPMTISFVICELFDRLTVFPYARRS